MGETAASSSAAIREAMVTAHSHVPCISAQTAPSRSAAPTEAVVTAHSHPNRTAHSQRTMPTTVLEKKRHDRRSFATTISEEESRAKYGRGHDIIMSLGGIPSTVLCANTRHSNGYGIGYGRNNNRKEEPGSHCEFVAAKKAVEPHEAAQRQEDALKKAQAKRKATDELRMIAQATAKKRVSEVMRKKSFWDTNLEAKRQLRREAQQQANERIAAVRQRIREAEAAQGVAAKADDEAREILEEEHRRKLEAEEAEAAQGVVTKADDEATEIVEDEDLPPMYIRRGSTITTLA